MGKTDDVAVVVCSSHGNYDCAADGRVIYEYLDPHGDHQPGQRVRFEWPDDVIDAVDILACVEYHADGTIVPADEDFLRDRYSTEGD